MGAGAVIAEFLASVGFKADEASLKSSLAKVAAFGLGIQAVALGIYAGITRVAQGEAALASQADTLGTTSAKLQELGYVAEQSGSSLDAVTRSMEGLVAQNPRIKDAAAALELAGERMKRMNEVQQKAYAARMGIDPSLIPALTRDASALKDEFRQMYAVAGHDAKEAGRASRDFMAEIGKLATMASLLAKSVALAFIGKIRHDVENLRRVIMDNFDKIRRIFELVIAVVLRVSAVISAFVYRTVKVLSALVTWFDTLSAGQQKLVFGAGLLLAAWKLLNAGFLASPLGMLVTGLAAIVALVDDYLTFMEGGEAYFDWGPWAGTIDAVVAALAPILGVIMGIAQGIAAAIGPALQGTIAHIGRMIDWFGLWGKYLKALFSGDAAQAAALGQQIFTGFYDIVVGLFSNMVATITAFFTAMWPSVQATFPDFAVWAEQAAASITGIFGTAIQWVRDKLNALVGFLPDWVKDQLGLVTAPPGDTPDAGGPEPAPGGQAGPAEAAPAPRREGAGTERPAPPGEAPPGEAPLARARDAAQGTRGAVLRPGPAQTAAAMTKTEQHVSMNAKTEIHMHTSDPVAAGNQVAARQSQVNADLVRNTRAAAR